MFQGYECALVQDNELREDELEGILQERCKIFYLFFRFLFFFIGMIKREIKQNSKSQFARYFLNILQDTTIIYEAQVQKRCDFKKIFKHCCQNRLQKNVSCSCQTNATTTCRRINDTTVIK